MASKVSAEMFEVVVPVAFTKGFQSKAYMLYDLVERCHRDYYRSPSWEASTPVTTELLNSAHSEFHSVNARCPRVDDCSDFSLIESQ